MVFSLSYFILRLTQYFFPHFSLLPFLPPLLGLSPDATFLIFFPLPYFLIGIDTCISSVQRDKYESGFRCCFSQ